MKAIHALRPAAPRAPPRRAGRIASLALVGILVVASAAGGHGQARAGAANAEALRQTPAGRPLVLTFSEPFDTFRRWSKGSGVWRTTFGDGRQTGPAQRTLAANGELQLYVDPDFSDARGRIGVDPFQLHDGVLDIVAQPSTPQFQSRAGRYGYTSGLITTQPSFSQLYGYFEMRAKLPRGKGLWPAFWLLPADMTWPPEIDIMESIGDPTTLYVTAHSATTKAVGVPAHVSPDAFHVFAVSWDPRQLIWYVDGAEVARQPTPTDMHKPMYILANLAIGGGWAGAPDPATAFPARFSIAYIRAYRFAS